MDIGYNVHFYDYRLPMTICRRLMGWKPVLTIIFAQTSVWYSHALRNLSGPLGDSTKIQFKKIKILYYVIYALSPVTRKAKSWALSKIQVFIVDGL